MEADEILMMRAQTGDESAFDLLIARYVPMIYRYVMRMVRDTQMAADIVQETCIKVWRSLARYQEGAAVRTWIFTISHRTAIDHLRKKRVPVFSALDDDHPEEHIADHEPLADERAIAAQDSAVLTSAIEQLSVRYREVVVLRHEQELTFEEMAAVLGEPMNTVKSRYRRALAVLRIALEEMHQNG